MDLYDFDVTLKNVIKDNNEILHVHEISKTPSVKYLC